MGKSVVYILSKVEKAVAFEWIVEELSDKKVEISFIILHNQFNSALVKFLEEKKIACYQLYFARKIDFPVAWIKVFRILARLNPDIVHTHLFEGSLIGLSASKLLGVKRRIYTRHHSTFHHDYYPKAVIYDKFISYLATDIVAISENVKKVLIEKEKVDHSKIHLIEHGFRLEQFKNIPEERVNTLRIKYNIPNNKLIIGVVSRYIKWKGVEYVIEAFRSLISKESNVHLLLANASGDYSNYIKSELNKLPTGSYTEIDFEEDVFALYQLMDIFIHVPIDNSIEAFGQTYIEALASGVPSIFTLSGIANDFIRNEKNALIVMHRNSDSIADAIIRLMHDPTLKEEVVNQGIKDVNRFRLENMINKLINLYQI